MLALYWREGVVGVTTLLLSLWVVGKWTFRSLRLTKRKVRQLRQDREELLMEMRRLKESAASAASERETVEMQLEATLTRALELENTLHQNKKVSSQAIQELEMELAESEEKLAALTTKVNQRADALESELARERQRVGELDLVCEKIRTERDRLVADLQAERAQCAQLQKQSDQLVLQHREEMDQVDARLESERKRYADRVREEVDRERAEGQHALEEAVRAEREDAVLRLDTALRKQAQDQAHAMQLLVEQQRARSAPLEGRLSEAQELVASLRAQLVAKDAQLRSEREAHSNTRAQHEAALESLRREHAQLLDDLQREHNQAMDSLRQEHASVVDSLRQEHTQRECSQCEDHRVKVAALESAHCQVIAEQKRDFDDALNEQLHSEKATVQKLQTLLENAEHKNTKLSEELNKLEARSKKLRRQLRKEQTNSSPGVEALKNSPDSNSGRSIKLSVSPSPASVSSSNTAPRVPALKLSSLSQDSLSASEPSSNESITPPSGSGNSEVIRLRAELEAVRAALQQQQQQRVSPVPLSTQVSSALFPLSASPSSTSPSSSSSPASSSSSSRFGSRFPEAGQSLEAFLAHRGKNVSVARAKTEASLEQNAERRSSPQAQRLRVSRTRSMSDDWSSAAATAVVQERLRSQRTSGEDSANGSNTHRGVVSRSTALVDEHKKEKKEKRRTSLRMFKRGHSKKKSINKLEGVESAAEPAHSVSTAPSGEAPAASSSSQQTLSSSPRGSAAEVASSAAGGVSRTWLLDPTEVVLEDRLAQGASGEVFRGQFRGQPVAVKVMKGKCSEKQVKDFLQEFELLASVKIKYTVYLYGVILQPTLCMVMEYCEHGSLYHVMKDRSLWIGWPHVFKFFDASVRGIHCLHSWKPAVLHRDLKSPNLLVDSNWTVKLCDFGLSRFADEETNAITLQKVRGTYTHSPPEVFHGQSYTTKSDIYSLGVVFWELVNRCIKGRYESPFSEFVKLKFDFQILLQASEGLRPTIPSTTPSIVVRVIQLCWNADPEKRPTAVQLLDLVHDIEREYSEHQDEWDAVAACQHGVTPTTNLIAQAGLPVLSPRNRSMSR